MSCNGMSFFPANFILRTSQDQQDEDDDSHYNPNKNHNHQHQDQPPIFPPQDFCGVAAFLRGKRSMHHLSGMMVDQQNGFGDTIYENNNANNVNVGDEYLSDDDGSLGSGGDQKKKRLNIEQVKRLEKSFEMGNKLEPYRKLQLARALGVEPRQIAIWFQNRRARWKTKQLEKDYDALKRQFDTVKSQNEVLQSQNQKLQSQIQALTSGREGEAAGNATATESFNLNKETVDQRSCSNRSENHETEKSSGQINMDMSTTGGGGGTGTDSMPLFPTSSSPNTNSPRLNSSSNLSATQLFFHHTQNHHHHPQQQQQQQQHNVKDDNFSNMFCGIEDQSGFWPWLEQQQHFS